MDPINVLIFTDWFQPGYKAGGPIRSVVNLVEHLGEVANFRIVTSNTDFNDPNPYKGIVPNKWKANSAAQIIYLDNRYTMMSFLLRKLERIDREVIYLNSLFSVRFTLVPLVVFKWLFASSKIIIAPRGMLGKGALEIKSTKKKLFLQVAKVFRLYKGVTWHATSLEEEAEIKACFGACVTTCVVPNIPTLTIQGLPDRTKERQVLRLLFCSRISVKKNLLLAIEMLKNTAVALTEGQLIFDIYGPIEDVNYWKRCKALMKEVQSDRLSIRYGGVLNPKEIQAVFANYHVFFLPTAHENYGHIIVEAMGCGLPVILSRNTPWNELEVEGVGWNIDISTNDQFVAIIEKCLAMESEQYAQMSNNTYQWIRKHVEMDQLKGQMLDLFSPNT